MLVIAVAQKRSVDVVIPEAGQHRHPLGGNLLVARRNRQRFDRSDLLNAIAANQHHAVADRLTRPSIDQRAADESQWHRRRGWTL